MTKELLDYFDQDELAANVWKSKYALEGEYTPDDMHRRMAKEFARVDKKYQQQENQMGPNGNKADLSKYGQEREALTEEKIYKLFKDFKYIVPQGSIMATLGTNNIASLSNCWVAESPHDSYGGILKTDSELAYYYKRRGGVGTDISNLRPKGTKTNNTANSTTGAVSFMSRFSNTTREVAMEGRRGALMLSMSVNHPDSMDFIKVKRDGVSVTGANISLRITDEFMEAVEQDTDYILRYPCESNIGIGLQDSYEDEYNKLVHKNPYYTKRIKAREYWDEIIKSAKNHAEPGLMYWDNMNNYDPASVYTSYTATCSNPCVTGDTLVLTKNGYKRADSLNEGDLISTVIGEESIKTKEINENVQVYLVKLSDGGEIKATASHQFHKRIKNSKFIEEVMLKNLEVGDSIRVCGNMGNILIEYGENYKKGLKLGVLIGDGCYTNENRTIRIASNIEDGKYNNKLIKLFGEDNFNKGYFGKDSNSMSIVLNKSFSDKIREEYSLPELYSFEKYIDLEKLSGIDEMMGVLDGLLATDGNVNLYSNHPQLRFMTSSEKLAKNIRLMLLAIGSHCTVTESFDKGGSIEGREIKRNHTKYTVNVSGESLRNYAQLSKIINLHEEKGLKLKKALTSSILSGNNWSAKIISITPLEREMVYDFFCEESDTWITNGYVSKGCGEQFLNPNDSCRLMALNMYSFIKNPFTKEAYIDYTELYEIAYEHFRLGDDLIDLELEYIQRIINKIESDPEPDEIKSGELNLWKKSYTNTKAGRRIGLGITALADMLAGLNVKYDSDEGMNIISKVMRTKMKAEFDCAIDLSILRGCFQGWSDKLEFDSYNSIEYTGRNKFYEMLLDEFPAQVSKMRRYGRRSVSWSTVAPTGSVSILTQTSSGCEPLFQPFYMRRKKINPNDKDVRVDFVDETGDSWQEFPVLHPKFKEWIKLKPDFILQDVKELDKETLQQLFEQSPWHGSTANDINWIKRNKIQSVLQKYTTNAISSTINLPSTVTEKEVSDIYLSGWKLGLKGQTVYVDGSRSGVLVSNTKKDEITTFNDNHAPTRPKSLDAKLIRFNNNKEKWIAFVGLLDSKPYEIFTGMLDDIKIPLKIEEGKITKRKDENGEKSYVFEYDGGEEEIGRVFNEDYWNYGKLVSGMLRHGMPLHYAVDMVNTLKFQEDHINTWKNGVARTLKKFIPDGKVEGLKCSDCGSLDVIFEEGCSKCTSCGMSRCS